MIKTVKELKEELQKIPDNAKIQIGYKFKIIRDGNVSERYESKNIENITKVIDIDTNKGYFIINVKD